MSGTKDLKELLDKLKVGMGPPPQSQPEKELPRCAADGEARPAAARSDRFIRPYRAPEPRSSTGGLQNPAWSGNMEGILFGTLASLILVLGGILAGLEYLVLIGVVFFSFFSMVMVLTFFRYYTNSRRVVAETPGLADRVDALSKKIELLSSRAVSKGGAPVPAGNPEKERELEHKVEELRVLVKTLSKVVGMGK